MHKVSLHIINYNRAQYLAQAIESVLAQNYSDFELILWDDGSSDQSYSIMQSYESYDSRIRVLHSSNLGFTQALDRAIRLSQGEYIGWVDSDDMLEASALEKTVSALEQNPSVGVVYTSYFEMNMQGKNIIPGKRCQVPYSKDRLLETFMTFHFRLIRRQAYSRVNGLDLSFRYSQDYDLCLKLSEITNFLHIKEYLYYYRVHCNSISNMHYKDQQDYAQQAIQNAIKRRKLTQL